MEWCNIPFPCLDFASSFHNLTELSLSAHYLTPDNSYCFYLSEQGNLQYLLCSVFKWFNQTCYHLTLQFPYTDMIGIHMNQDFKHQYFYPHCNRHFIFKLHKNSLLKKKNPKGHANFSCKKCIFLPSSTNSMNFVTQHWFKQCLQQHLFRSLLLYSIIKRIIKRKQFS